MRWSAAVVGWIACAPQGPSPAGDGPPGEETGTSEPTPTPPGPTDSAATGPADSAPPTGCPPVTDRTRALVVTDIDETLTTSDREWLTQIALPNSDPEMRPDADLLMQLYHERGYRVVYVTARGRGLRLLDGTTAREATERWLTDHGFPFRSEDVYLARGLAAFGDQAATYKEEVLTGLLADGHELVYAYGNSDTDIAAYQAVGIPDDRVFLVGRLAGQFGVEPIPTAEAYSAHLPVADGFVGCAPGPSAR